jgi:hypothetical protein
LKNILEYGTHVLWELSHPRMLNARTYFARMNNNRTHDSWLTEHHLLKGAEEFFRLNEYSNIEYDKEFDKGSRRVMISSSNGKQSDLKRTTRRKRGIHDLRCA